MMGLIRKASGILVVETLVNFVLPYVIYIKAEAGISHAHALMARSAPARPARTT
jgi:hypothetical protein